MYLDAGFGTMIIQFAIAAIAGGSAYLLLFRKKVMDFIRRKKEEKNTALENTDEGITDGDERV